MLSVEAAAAYRICIGMSCEEDFGPHGLVLFESVEILWNLLEHGRKEAAAQLANPQCCKSVNLCFAGYVLFFALLDKPGRLVVPSYASLRERV